MDILNKLDLFIDPTDETTVAGDVAINTAQGKIDVVGGECPKGMNYDKLKKVCVPSKNEASVVGGSYLGGTTVNIIGSGQTRTWSMMKHDMIDLARKEPVENEMDDPTETNILGRKGLKFDKESGAYVPSIWGDDE